MASKFQVDAQHLTQRAYRRSSKPVGSTELAGQSVMYGASVGVDAGEAAVVEDRVRRRANRHRCQAPARLREALAAAQQDGPRAAAAAVLAGKIAADPGAYCGDPRHGEDAAWLAEVLELLGLRETVRRRTRGDAISARPRSDYGRCGTCGHRHALKLDGTLSAHRTNRYGEPCPGSGEKPVEVDR